MGLGRGITQNCLRGREEQRESIYNWNSSPERSLLGSERCEGSSHSGLSPFVLEPVVCRPGHCERKSHLHPHTLIGQLDTWPIVCRGF